MFFGSFSESKITLIKCQGVWVCGSGGGFSAVDSVPRSPPQPHRIRTTAITLAIPGVRGRDLAESLTINDVARCWKINMTNHLLKKSGLLFAGPFLSLYVAAEGHRLTTNPTGPFKGV